MKNIYEIIIYLKGKKVNHFLNLCKCETAIAKYQEVVDTVYNVIRDNEIKDSVKVLLLRNDFCIAEIRFKRYFDLIRYCKSYKNTYLPCDPLCEVVKKWKQ